MSYRILQLEPYIGDEEKENLIRAIDRKWITEGEFSAEFLKEIKIHTGAKYAALANNGTLALFLSLLALNIGPGDEVIVADFTFIATGACVEFAGAVPIFCDVDMKDGNIDPSKIEALITDKTKAIIPVHVYGQSADMDEIMRIAKKHNLRVIEDAAQGFGVKYKGKHVGTIGDIGTISFFADKTITTGEGAVILTDNHDIYEKILYLRNQGRIKSGSFTHAFLGMNFRMTDLQCAVGLAQINKFETIKKEKLRNYKLYKEILNSHEKVKFLEENSYCNIIPFRMNILVENAEYLMKYMENNGIQSRGFFYPLHKQPCFDKYKTDSSNFINSIALNLQGVSLPVHLGLSDSDIEYICEIITRHTIN